MNRFDPIELEKYVSSGAWRLDVDTPRFDEQDSHSRARLAVVTIKQNAPRVPMVEVPGLEAREYHNGKFLCRIALDQYEPTDTGFIAHGPRYADLGTNGQESEEPSEDSKEDDEPRPRGSVTDPYYKSMPAIQYWEAVRLNTKKSR